MPRVWRLVKTRYAAAAFDGEGARGYGGRWNSPGVRVVYGAGSVALAILEVLVHLNASELLPAYSLVSAAVPDDLVEPLPAAALPANWRDSPPPSEAAAVGDGWVAAGRTAALAVPSAVVESERNYLLNPAHAGFARIVVAPPERFAFDPRLAR